jgi:hypothetical protein
VFLIALFGLYVCYLSFTQIRLENKGEESGAEKQTGHVCTRPVIPDEELPYVHFPKPEGYNRSVSSLDA